MIAFGAGEGAAAVAEQLAFEQVAGDGGAVEGDERFLCAVGEFVDGACEDFLAGPALPGDEDVDVCASDALGGHHLLAHVAGNYHSIRHHRDLFGLPKTRSPNQVLTRMF